MLKSIFISNYALIDKVEVDLSPGLNIITGETGAGKSIMLGALSMLLGARADIRVVTDTSKKSIIEAFFCLDGGEELKDFFSTNGLDWIDDGTLILRREISPNGRSRAFVNDSPVTLGVLEQISKQLVDIHSQHQNLLLADPAFQLHIIDVLAGNGDRLNRYREDYKKYKESLSEFARVKKNIQDLRENAEQYRKELLQIEAMELTDGEETDLEAEREYLSNITVIKQSLEAIVDKLSGADEDTILGGLRMCADDMQDVENLVPDGKSLAERFESVYIEVQDLNESIERIYGDITPEPQRLEWVEERLGHIYRLQKKYKVDTIGDLLKVASEISNKLDSIDGGELRLRELQTRAKEQRQIVLKEARELSAIRREEASKFMEELKEKARPLGMKNIDAVADFTYSTELTDTGIDRIDFKFSFNKNQAPLSIGSTASGGEISRIMLCVKNILARRMQFPTIIFDEIDTGVSGEIAHRMGDMMLEIAGETQVLAITHLPQVAAKGTSHFKVYKEDDDDKTHTHLLRLNRDERIREIAVMLSGSTVGETALANARSLLEEN